ncbi:MAG: hypothetical protein WC668_00530 [Patescibacteria group bacterium]|jgi:membrane protein implicated in regulation of membrane protease activity
MNTLLSLCLWHSLYIGILAAALSLFTISIIPTIILVNGIKQRRNSRYNFKITWFPPQWLMSCFYMLDYVMDVIYHKIKKLPVPPWQEYRNSKYTIDFFIEKTVGEDGIIGGLISTLFGSLVLAIINGAVVCLILGLASLLLFLWWLTLPIIIICLAFLFLYRKYREYQSALERQRKDNGDLRAIIEEFRKGYDDIKVWLQQSNPADQEIHEQPEAVKSDPADRTAAGAEDATALAGDTAKQPATEQAVDKSEKKPTDGPKTDGPKKTRKPRRKTSQKPDDAGSDT